MEREKERIRVQRADTNKNRAVSSHKFTAERASVKSNAAKKVVSKSAATGKSAVTGQYRKRAASDGSKRTTNSPAARQGKSDTKRSAVKSGKKTGFMKKLPGTVRFFIRLACVVVILVIIVSIWTGVSGWALSDLLSHGIQNIKDFSALSGKAESFPITLNGSISIKQEKLDNAIAVLTDNSVTIYNKNGHMARTQAHYMASPALAAAGNYALIYDIGGSKWRFESASGTILSGESEYNILSAAVSESGYFALVCVSDDAHSGIYVYNRSGKKIFGWNCVNYYITAAALSNSGRKLTVCGLNAENGMLKSAVYVLDVENSKEISLTTFTDELLLDVDYLKSGMAIVVGENSIITVSEDGGTVEEAFSDNIVTAYDFEYGSGFVYCTSPVEGSGLTTLTVLDTEGRQRFSEKLSCNITDVALSSDYVCLLSQGSAMTYTIGGKKIADFDVTVDAKRIDIIKDKAYVLCNTVLRRYAIA